MSERKPSDTADRVVIRTPGGMRKRLNELARENGRTATAEAVKALEVWLAHDPEVEPAFVRLPEPLRERVTAAARFNGRTVLDEIAARLADSFKPEGPRHVEGDQLDLRAEIRDAMHEAIEGLLGEPEKLKAFAERMKRRDGGPVSG